MKKTLVDMSNIVGWFVVGRRCQEFSGAVYEYEQAKAAHL
jgi:hypothetical protein